MEYPALERIEQLARNLDGLHRRLNTQVEQLRAQPLAVTSASGAVEVAVDHAGRVQHVRVQPGGMRLSADQLSTEITRTLAQAQHQAATRLRESMHEVIGQPVADDPME